MKRSFWAFLLYTLSANIRKIRQNLPLGRAPPRHSSSQITWAAPALNGETHGQKPPTMAGNMISEDISFAQGWRDCGFEFQLFQFWRMGISPRNETEKKATRDGNSEFPRWSNCVAEPSKTARLFNAERPTSSAGEYIASVIGRLPWGLYW